MTNNQNLPERRVACSSLLFYLFPTLCVGTKIVDAPRLHVGHQVKNNGTQSVRRNVPTQSIGTSMISPDSIVEIAESKP